MSRFTLVLSAAAARDGAAPGLCAQLIPAIVQDRVRLRPALGATADPPSPPHPWSQFRPREAQSGREKGGAPTPPRRGPLCRRARAPLLEPLLTSEPLPVPWSHCRFLGAIAGSLEPLPVPWSHCRFLGAIAGSLEPLPVPVPAMAPAPWSVWGPAPYATMANVDKRAPPRGVRQMLTSEPRGGAGAQA